VEPDSTGKVYNSTAARLTPSQLSHIPTIGGSDVPVLSYIGSIRFIKNSKALLSLGYAGYRGRLFKVAMLDRWLVVVSGAQLIEELRALPERDMSLHEALCQVSLLCCLQSSDLLHHLQIFEMDYTLGPSIRKDPYHAHLLHSNLTKHLSELFPIVNQEIMVALEEYLVVEGSGM
jgi:hypothetical protein